MRVCSGAVGWAGAGAGCVGAGSVRRPWCCHSGCSWFRAYSAVVSIVCVGGTVGLWVASSEDLL